MHGARITRWIGSALLALTATPAGAQQPAGRPWHPGPLGAGVASGLYASSPEAVTVQGTASVTLALDAASLSMARRLGTGALHSRRGTAIPRSAQALLLRVMGEGDAEAADHLARVLARSGLPGEAVRLADALRELLSMPRPGQLHTTVRLFDEMVRKTDLRFLTEPPAEFLAIHAVLSELSAIVAQHR